jgi:hypothetical protein
MRRILLSAVVGVASVLATATTASADVGDIRNLSVTDPLQGTAELAEVSGSIRCTTTIQYGLVVGVAQPTTEGAFDFIPETGEPEVEEPEVQGVGAFGPNAGNEANSPCSTTLQDWEVVVERNRDSGTYRDTDDTGDGVDLIVFAGTSAENGDRGPGPFIGDLGVTEVEEDAGEFERTDP